MPKPRNADGGRLAPAMSLNSVKVYNLSSVGKALPAWLSAGKRKALVQKKEDNERLSSLSKPCRHAAAGHPALLGLSGLALGTAQTLRACTMALRPVQRQQAFPVPQRPFLPGSDHQARGDTGALVPHLVRPHQV